jgi:hypothetical protein
VAHAPFPHALQRTHQFVRIGENRLSAVFGVQDRARKTYDKREKPHNGKPEQARTTAAALRR